ncbi:MAG: 2-isopropylmalate synthase [Candidatus Omnitrophota bacterium]
MQRLLINDITLRDGEQAAGVNFFPEEKVRLAGQLVKLGLPIIEAGFPAASEADARGVKLVAEEFGKQIVVSAMCRAHRRDIEIAADSLGNAPRRRIQVVMGTSDIHLKHKFNMGRNEALDLSVDMVKYARTFADDVEFAAEDSTRSERKYLLKVCRACVEAGARTVELPDTVGYATPEGYASLVKDAVDGLPGDAVVSTHCHNDLGLAVANTLAGIKAGARQAEVTVNGIGERVGNASAEEVIMALMVRNDEFGVDIGYIKTREIMKTSLLVEELSKIRVAFNKAIVGRNAFLHESGIHQDGMLKSPQTYQLIDPREIGLDGYRLVLGKLSGAHALREKLKALGLDAGTEELKRFAGYFKDNSAKKKFITDDDVINLFKRFRSEKVA